MRKILAIVVAAAIIGLGLSSARDATAGGGCHDTILRDVAGISVDLKGNCFWPTVIRAQKGESITWTSRDVERHTVTGVANSWGTYDELANGDSVTYAFDKSGVFPYFCILHPSMVGAVVVGDGQVASSEVAAGAVRAVSAAPPGDSDSPAQATADSSGDSVSPWLIAILVAAVAALFAGLFAGRRLADRRPTP